MNTEFGHLIFILLISGYTSMSATTIICKPAIEPDITINHKIASNTAVNETSSNINISSEPIVIMNDTIRIYGEQITTNKFYPFEYKEKKYLLFRPAEKTTEIYEVVE